uniref:Ovule protein n=1 Tax=Ascaris lumbricoides TaxID=6252 RepID=A0A0M3HG25_ASCLU
MEAHLTLSKLMKIQQWKIHRYREVAFVVMNGALIRLECHSSFTYSALLSFLDLHFRLHPLHLERFSRKF